MNGLGSSPPDLKLRALRHLTSNRTLHLILLPTEKCNFRCTYCYEKFEQGRMPQRVRQGIKALIARRFDSLDLLQITWFGGEPLIASDIVEDISGFAQGLSEENQHVRYEAGASTNGAKLTDARREALLAVGVRNYQISLDGPREVHDESRLSADGGPTFDLIWRNLLRIRDSDSDVTVLLRVHFDGNTVDRLGDLLLALREEFSRDPRFAVGFKPLARLGGQNDAAIEVLSAKTAQEAIRRFRAEIYGGSAAPNPFEGEDVCYAARPNSLVVRSNGRIAKCTVALDDARNDIGHIRADGTVSVDSDRLAPWIRGISDLDQAALACPLQGMPPARVKQPTATDLIA